MCMVLLKTENSQDVQQHGEENPSLRQTAYDFTVKDV